MQEQTFSLKIIFPDSSSEELYEQVKAFLSSRGFEEFSEGYLDVDLMPDEIDHNENYFKNTAFELELFRYNREELEGLRRLLAHEFKSLSYKSTHFKTSDWQEAWKDSFKPIRTQKFYIYPPWEEATDEDLIGLKIEPGMAFGTGQHQTTELCLKAMERLASELRGNSLLDVGTGTGILAIAAVKLNCSKVAATDIDLDAVNACKQNQRMNNVSFDVIHTATPQLEQKFSFVVANILVSTILSLLDSLKLHCERSGYLLLSGVLVEQSREIIEKCSEVNFTLVFTEEEGGWVALLFKHNE